VVVLLLDLTVAIDCGDVADEVVVVEIAVEEEEKVEEEEERLTLLLCGGLSATASTASIFSMIAAAVA
jgi:hypothetical protein